MELESLYFFTATITNWRQLLKPDKYKLIILQSLSNLVNRGKIKVYAFVIMPNHIHLIWEFLDMNGKEMPNASLMKYTSHSIQKDLQKYHPLVYEIFKVESEIRAYHFWQRNSLAIKLFSPKVVYQKLDYIHNNPCKGKWMLSANPIEYKFSSAKFYETGLDEFDLLTHVGERL